MMQFSNLVALLALGGNLAAALPTALARDSNELSTAVESRQAGANLLSPSCIAKLQSLGIPSPSGLLDDFGVNALAAGTSGVWVGNDGSYTSLFNNTSPEEVCLIVWGAEPLFQASFVSVVQPLIAIALPPHGGSTTLSFAEGQSGAWAGIYPHTLLNNGQISNTWGEFTMSPEGVVDISREVYTQGRSMRIIGPSCITDMYTCVFTCNDLSVTQCGTYGSYALQNCAPGSQAGAQSGLDNTSGGCGWNGASAVHLRTEFF